MELRDLKAFVTLGEVLHFGQAAARQHITQSALSKQIRRLEVAFGGELFERNASSTRLTPLGRALYGDACALVARKRAMAAGTSNLVATPKPMRRVPPLPASTSRAVRPSCSLWATRAQASP